MIDINYENDYQIIHDVDLFKAVIALQALEIAELYTRKIISESEFFEGIGYNFSNVEDQPLIEEV